MGRVGADRWADRQQRTFPVYCRSCQRTAAHFELAADAAGTCPLLFPNAATWARKVADMTSAPYVLTLYVILQLPLRLPDVAVDP